MSLLVSIFAIIAVLAGAFFFIAGTLGLLRFGDTLSRVHALTKADNLGLGLIVLGLLPLADSITDALKLVVIWALVLLGGTTAAQLVASAVRRQQDPPS
jgi:multicomponent Na+:H+ antiporter subunit G